MATYGAILDAAASLIARDGLAKPTTNHIAERSGANIGSVYQYFGSKEAILAALVDRAFDRYETAMTTAFSAAQSFPLHDGFDALVRAHIEALRHQAPLLRVILRHLVAVDRVERYHAAKRRMLEAFVGYVTAHRHEVDLGDLDSASRTMIDCVEAITMDALFAKGEDLADDPRVQELLSVARRYFLLRS